MSHVINSTTAAIRSAILSMLEESDQLDYHVKQAIPRVHGSIDVSQSVSGKPLCRIVWSETDSMSAWAVFYDGYKKAMRNTYVQHGYEASKDALLSRITEIFEYLDNGRELREWMGDGQS